MHAFIECIRIITLKRLDKKNATISQKYCIGSHNQRMDRERTFTSRLVCATVGIATAFDVPQYYSMQTICNKLSWFLNFKKVSFISKQALNNHTIKEFNQIPKMLNVTWSAKMGLTAFLNIQV